MPLTPGTKLGNYEVVESVGAGGMGEVYRARDTKLDRKVALKILPPELAESEEHRAVSHERQKPSLRSINFSWAEDFGDIWVMDVVTDEGE